MPEALGSLRTPWRIAAGVVMGVGSLLSTAIAVEKSNDYEPAIKMEAGQAKGTIAATVGRPVIAELCSSELLSPADEAECELPPATIPPVPETIIPVLKEVEENVKQLIPTTTATIPKPTTTTTVPPLTTTSTAPPQPAGGGKVDWMNQAGISQASQGHVDYIMTDESGWNPAAVSANKCIGLGQNCRDEEGDYWLDDACPNWREDPVCQLGRFEQYAVGRYGSWEAAYHFKRRNGWW